MKKFFVNISLFMIIFIMIYSILESTARNMYNSKSELYFQLDSFEKKMKDVEVIVFGTSHIGRGVNPEYFDLNTYNLGFNSQDLYYDYQLFLKYNADLKKLKYIILSLDYFSFGFDEADSSIYLVNDYFFRANIYPRNGFNILFVLSTSVFWLNSSW